MYPKLDSTVVGRRRVRSDLQNESDGREIPRGSLFGNPTLKSQRARLLEWGTRPLLDRGDPLSYTSDVDELFALILGTIAEFLLEIFVELIAAVALDLTSRALSGLFTGLSDAFKGNRVLIGSMYALLGMSAGGLSLLALPHRLVHHPIGFHGISLLISPIVVGWVLSYVGAVMERRGKKLTALETFGYGYVFALGMTFIRFLFAK